jgi:hypothetical protein
MDLGVAVRMAQHTVLGAVRAAMGTPHELLAVPAGPLREALVPDHTEAVWLLP